MRSIHSPEYARNLGFWNPDEQQQLINSTVALGGVGGAGFPIGLALARAGVSEFAAADPDVIANTNFNRHPGAFTDTVGRNKTEVFAEMVHRINPDANVRIYDQGINAENVEEFVEGADLVFDGIDFNSPAESVRLHRQARAMNKPVLTGLEIGPSAVITSFKPDSEFTFEQTIGCKPTDSLEAIVEKSKDGVDLSTSLPYLPYKSTHIQVMEAVQKGADLPTTVFGVELFGAVSGQEAFMHLTGRAEGPVPSRAAMIGRKLLGHHMRGNSRRDPVWAPDYLVVDMERMEMKTVRQSKARFYTYAGLLAVRSKLGMNPAIQYGD